MPRKKNTNIDAVEKNPTETPAEIVEVPVKKRTGRTSKKVTADSAVDIASAPVEALMKKPRAKRVKADVEKNTSDIKTENVTVPVAATDIREDATETVTKAADVKTLDPAEPAAAEKAPKRAPKAKKEPALAITTVLQVGGKEFDITNIAETALKTYKSVHKRKTVTEFVVYVKPEENAAYYTVNGEGSEEYKIDLD